MNLRQKFVSFQGKKISFHLCVNLARKVSVRSSGALFISQSVYHREKIFLF